MYNLKYVINNRKVFKPLQLCDFMPSIEEHIKNFKMFLTDIEEKIRMNVIVERQKLVGFGVSEASANLFAVFLLKNKLIDPGFNVNHRFFVSEKRAKETFPFDFPMKEEVISLLVKIDSLRNRLCYGKEKDAKEVNEDLSLLYKLKEMIEK